ncbi:MAG: nucleotidyl transferase AbiEii/AbiGii toxin family protein [candidate division KSB1 bacterium]|nr:nucleotidyl transferase AbiEii/AbiGii toxin family protein [candidate division KSB1 bacterium]MDQ7066217.1 nucleotidyl transferase AbiEii/AbiGii toxin family protein [candidate division KSB1 bacterium]
MNILEKHEVFEIEVLDRLKSVRILDSLVFGGGTMLRLCHEMRRFSADLDFWKRRKIADDKLFARIHDALTRFYEITEAQIKHFSLLIAIRSPAFPRRLKIEVRRKREDWEYEEKIAFSRFSTRQVLLKGHTLRQTLLNKIAALMDRGEIRDAFDIEFILRQGVSLPELSDQQRSQLIRQLQKFKARDFKVTLGSVLEKEARDYYSQHGFRFLLSKLESPL